MIRILTVGLMALTFLMSSAHAGTKVIERTKYYLIKGNSAPEFAKSMSARGPYSRAKRKRAWATAGRKLSFQLVHQRVRGGCAVRDVNITMNITTTLPQLRRTRGVSRAELVKWKRMAGLLKRHEDVHVRYYRQLATRTYKALLRLAPAGSCRALDRAALRKVEQLSRRDSARNQRFDESDGRNYRRMTRLYAGA